MKHFKHKILHLRNKNLDNRVSFFSHLYDIWTGHHVLGDLLFVSSAIDSEVWQETLIFFLTANNSFEEIQEIPPKLLSYRVYLPMPTWRTDWFAEHGSQTAYQS